MVSAVCGLTNAPRIFSMDVGSKMRGYRAEPHPIDRCMWMFKDSSDKVVSRVGVHVDEFHICGAHGNQGWMKITEKIRQIYQWSPWKKGSFTSAGLEIQQLSNFEIRVTQQAYCHALRPVVIENEKSRSENDPLTPKASGELFRRTAFQCCARAGGKSGNSASTAPTPRGE